MFTDLAEQITELQQQEAEQRRLAREAEVALQIKTFLELAQQLAEAENYESALQQLEQAASLDPENARIQRARRRVLEASEKRDQLRHRKRQIEELASQVDARIADGQFQEAQELVKQALSELGDGHDLAQLRARIEGRRLEQQEASASELLNEAYRHFESGQFDLAEEKVDQALQLSADLPAAKRLQRKLVDRRLELGQLETLESARKTIVSSLSDGAIDRAEAALEDARDRLGNTRELRELEKRIRDAQAARSRQREIEGAAVPIEKLIQKNRLKKASGALAEAVRRHGQDAAFDELRSRIEDLVEREQAAQQILDTEVGSQPGMRQPIWLVAAAGLIVIAILAYVLWPQPQAPSRSAELGSTAESLPEETLDELLADRSLGRFYALVIGNNEYRSGLTQLETAVNDAEQLAEVLEGRYGFETQLLVNATRYELLSALEGYIGRVESPDNLLLFYAGHGFVDEVTGRAYWQPVDAEADNTANWISSLEVSDLLLDIPARRILVIADSCFSGAFANGAEAAVETIPAQTSPEEVVDQLDLKSRRVLSSGSVQPVLDNGADGNSVFSRALLGALESTSAAIESTELFQQVQQQVASASFGKELQQEPQFARLESDAGGVFLFVPVDRTAP